MSIHRFKRFFSAIQSSASSTRRRKAQADKPAADRHSYALETLEERTLLSAVLAVDPIENHAFTVPTGGSARTVDLNSFFDDDTIDGSVVEFNTTLGSVKVELFDTATPLTVANFLFHVNRGDYTDSLFHRSVVDFIVQGGGFLDDTPNFTPVFQQDLPVQNEPGISNTRGTIAMAKRGNDPNSATNQWFFNLDDTNAANLDFQNGGFTAFGQVLGDGMTVVDAIAAVPIFNASLLNPAFSSMPLRNFTNTVFPDASNFLTTSSVNQVSELTYAAFIIPPTNGMTTDSISVEVDGMGILKVVSNNHLQGSIDVLITATAIDGTTETGTLTVNLGAAVQDFSGNGSTDIVWRNSRDGKNTIWEMLGLDRIDGGSNPIAAAPNQNWLISGVADFDGDNKVDIVWRNALTGRNVLWLMDGVNLRTTIDLDALVSADWQIAGAGDVNLDGKADLIWHNAKNGRNTAWLMDGTTRLVGEGGASATMPLARETDKRWQIAAVADINRDGGVDLMMRHRTTGQNLFLLLNREDGTLADRVSLKRVGNSDWQVGVIADINLDSRPDIVWRNSSNGRNIVWEMNPLFLTSITNRTFFSTTKRIARLANTDWQMPGLGPLSQINLRVLRKQVQAQKLQAAASSLSAPVGGSLLSQVDPILTFDSADEEQAFALDENGQVVR